MKKCNLGVCFFKQLEDGYFDVYMKDAADSEDSVFLNPCIMRKVKIFVYGQSDETTIFPIGK
jgi:hypothetical protein